MAFKKPSVTKIEADISKISIYLRSTKKFGKTTLFRDVILKKYGDPGAGLLIGCGSEIGYKMLDGLNATQVTTYEELVELKDWLISTKGTEHNIKIIAFDTADELALMAQKKTIKISNKENPAKPVRSIKAALGGFMAGEMYAANDLVKPLISELEQAGFGVWVIAHTAMKTIKDKGALEEDGYQQLTSNLDKYMESALGDCLDVVLTGVIDRETEEKVVGDKKKNYVTDTVRKLYFRGTTSIDAGGRFANGTVPDYIIFDKPDMSSEFISVVEDGMKNSRINFNAPATEKKVPAEEREEEVLVGMPAVDTADDNPPFEIDDEKESGSKLTREERLARIRSAFSGADQDAKKQIKGILIASNTDGSGKLGDATPDEALSKIEAALEIFD